jgi:heat shock protein HslJ
MRASTFLITAVIVTLLVTVAHAEPLRYRGEYTYGHEVNSFCPAINSQCYWLSGDTHGEVRDALQTLAGQNVSKPYQSLCVVIEAEIDRDASRDGFAADYDGLITVMKSYGRCDETSIVTQGDLQHHRWVLESINGEAIDADSMNGRIPDLDFGEHLHVSGNTGCNRISGRASLHDEYIRFGQLISTLMSCSPAQNEVERTIQRVLAGTAIEITIRSNYLNLREGEISLRYRLQDWVD